MSVPVACGSNVEHCEYADRIAEKAVERTFAALGIDVNDPEEIRHFQANMGFLWKMRKLSEKVGMVVILTIAGGLTTGVMAIVWDRIQK